MSRASFHRLDELPRAESQQFYCECPLCLAETAAKVRGGIAMRENQRIDVRRVGEAVACLAKISSVRYLPPEGPGNSSPSSNISSVWIVV